MRLRVHLSVVLAVLLVATAIAVSAFKPQSGQNSTRTIIARQLPLVDGLVPVEIQSQKADFRSSSEVAHLSFVVRNNTSKDISALCLVYSIILERNGVESSDTFFLVTESFVHKDVREGSRLRPITPGQQETLESHDEISYENAVIKRVETSIDYVEFEDKTTLGKNEHGARIISLVREGAEKYKDWLVSRYAKSAKSLDTIITSIQANDLPAELDLNTIYQVQGAKSYRRHMLRLYETRGRIELERFMQQ